MSKTKIVFIIISILFFISYVILAQDIILLNSIKQKYYGEMKKCNKLITQHRETVTIENEKTTYKYKPVYTDEYVECLLTVEDNFALLTKII